MPSVASLLLLLLAASPVVSWQSAPPRAGSHPPAVAAPGGGSPSTVINHAAIDVNRPGGLTTSYEYDAVGRLTAMVHPGNRRNEYKLDALGRVVQEVHPDLMTESTSFTPTGSQVASHTDRRGATTTVAGRDSAGRGTSATLAWNSTSVPLSTTYDSDGATESVTVAGDTTTTERNARAVTTAQQAPSGSTSYRRRNDDAVTSATTSAGAWNYLFTATGKKRSGGSWSGPGAGGVTVDYDGDGFVQEERLPGAVTRTYSRDAVGRVQSYTEVGPSGTRVWTYRYDGAKRLTRIDGPLGTETFAYDPSGRLAREVHSGQQVWSGDYIFDTAGRRTGATTYSGGLLLDGALVPMPSWLSATGLVSTASGAAGSAGAVATVTTAGFRPVSGELILVLPATASAAAGFALTDGVGALRLLATSTGGAVGLAMQRGTGLPGLPPSTSATVAMPKNGQLRLSWTLSGTVTLAPVLPDPAMGDTTAVSLAIALTGPVTSTAVTITAGSATLSAVTLYSPAQSRRTASTFDPMGRPILEVRDDGSAERWSHQETSGLIVRTATGADSAVTTWTYRLDILDRLVDATALRRSATGAALPSTTSAWTYRGADRHPLSRSSAAGTVTLRYDGDRLISGTATGNGTSVWWDGSPAWEAATAASAPVPYRTDGRGSIIGKEGDTTSQPSTAWGEPHRQASNGATLPNQAGLAYRGAWYDPTLDLVQMGARFYLPGSGRFLTLDPARAGGDWYAYCGGDPVNRSDLSGLAWKWTGSEWTEVAPIGSDPVAPDWKPKGLSDVVVTGGMVEFTVSGNAHRRSLEDMSGKAPDFHPYHVRDPILAKVWEYDTLDQAINMANSISDRLSREKGKSNFYKAPQAEGLTFVPFEKIRQKTYALGGKNNWEGQMMAAEGAGELLSIAAPVPGLEKIQVARKLSSVFSRVVGKGEKAGEVSERVVATARKLAPSEELAENMTKQFFIRPANTAAHHIVAWDSAKASGARKLLERFKIGINDAENGVFLPGASRLPGTGAVHSRVHTNDYFIEVERRLSQASNREEVLSVLTEIRQALSNEQLLF